MSLQVIPALLRWQQTGVRAGRVGQMLPLATDSLQHVLYIVFRLVVLRWAGGSPVYVHIIGRYLSTNKGHCQLTAHLFFLP